MNILVVGSGGREHALVWKIKQSPLCGGLYVAPGNPGTAQLAQNVSIKPTENFALVQFALQYNIDLVVVGPEDPLIGGLADMLKKHGILVFGPIAQAAQIEGSKAFSKEFMSDYGIPTAEYALFKDFPSAAAYVKGQKLPVVIKASGQALGKGVKVCYTHEEAMQFLREVMEKKVFGKAGDEVVIEEYLVGKEVSIHALSDGKNVRMLLPTRDHKPVGNGNTGKNTGGMGAYGPVELSSGDAYVAEHKIVKPTISGMASCARLFRGLLYPGLMLTPDGLRVLEFNCRFGDPETQVLMTLMKSDIVPLLMACARGDLGEAKLEWYPGYAVCVVLASGGYPDEYKKGFVIRGLQDSNSIDGVEVFHAGTQTQGNKIVTAGGRVLGVTAYAMTLDDARELAYVAVSRIGFEGMHYRTDIGAV